MDRHVLYAVNIDTVDAGDVFIDQISDFNVSPQISKRLTGADGAVFNTHAAVRNQEPRLTFTTSKLATVLAKIGIQGLPISSDADEPGLEAFLQKTVEGGTRASGAEHQKLTIKKGIIVPRTLNAGLDGADLDLEAIATWDGTNDPIIVADNQALTGTPSVSELFCVGPAYINGASLEGIQNISIDFGIQVTLRYHQGDVWPHWSGIMLIQPVITITTDDALTLSTFGLSGTAQGETNSVIYLRKTQKNGTRVANDVAEHISFTVDDGHISVDNVRGPHGSILASVVRIDPIYDGTNDPIVINTATVIA